MNVKQLWIEQFDEAPLSKPINLEIIIKKDYTCGEYGNN